MIIDKFIKGVEFDNPEEVLASVIPQNLKVLHVNACSVVYSNRKRESTGLAFTLPELTGIRAHVSKSTKHSFLCICLLQNG